jgi:Fe2+ transport system protein FeoA
MIASTTQKSTSAAHVETSSRFKTLAVLKPGEAAVIVGFNGEAAHETRLWEMGLMQGTPVRLVKHAPFGDPLQLSVRGFHLAISKKTAQSILVK